MVGIPGARSVHHVAYTVPDLDQAVDFFVRVIGAEVAYVLDRVADPDGDWMSRKLAVHPRAVAKIAMLRLGPTSNIELFEYEAPEQNRTLPRNSDVGGHHLAIFVDDVDKAVAYLRREPGVKILDVPETIKSGPIAGDTWVYFTTPWGMSMELMHMPADMPYEQTTTTRLFQPVRAWRNDY